MWPYAFSPVVVAALGATCTAVRSPSPRVVGVVQHFAAGVVFYAAAGELLPDAIRQNAVWPVVGGGGVGVVAMLLLRRVTVSAEQSPVGLLAASAVDALIDGLVLGLGFNAGQRQGVLLAIVLAIEFLFSDSRSPARSARIGARAR